MKRFLLLPFVFSISCFFMSTVLAGEIQNLTITTNDAQIVVSWDPLNNIEMFDEDGGYVLQYSTIQNDIRNDKTYRNQISGSQHSIALRAAGFERDEYYYFRVYSLRTDGRAKYLNNGSQILKWKWQSNGDIVSEYLEPNDPIIADNSDDAANFEFGKLRMEEFASSVHFQWSSPYLSPSDYDGFVIVLSKNNDLSNPLAEIKPSRSVTSAFVEGLSPETTYYAAGYLKNGAQRFGKSAIETFTTVAAFSSYQQLRYEKYVLTRTNLGMRHNIDGTTTTETDTENETSTTTETTTTNETTTTINTNDTNSIKARITELKALINKYQAEIRSLEAKLGNENTTTTRTTSRLQSIFELLRLRRSSSNE